MLLETGEVNPAAEDNEAVMEATWQGYYEIVRMLLERREVNPAANNNEAIRLAFQYGYTDIVRMMLERRGQWRKYFWCC